MISSSSSRSSRRRRSRSRRREEKEQEQASYQERALGKVLSEVQAAHGHRAWSRGLVALEHAAAVLRWIHLTMHVRFTVGLQESAQYGSDAGTAQRPRTSTIGTTCSPSCRP